MNKTVDFYIFTDIEYTQGEVPANVHFIKMTFDEVKSRLQREVGFKIKLSPYKLCDFRPVYGSAFYDYIKNYDYWGHCDFDVIFGDIRPFIDSELAKGTEQILQRGHFTLYANTQKCRELYKKTADKNLVCYPYTKVFRTGHSCWFDEYLGMGVVADKYLTTYKDQHVEKVVLDVPSQPVEFTSVVDKRKYFCVWENGKLYRIMEDTGDKQEFMYIHLQKRRMQLCDDINKILAADKFYILPTCFSIKQGYSITDEYRKAIKFDNKKKRIKMIVGKFFKYGPIAAVKHKYYMHKVIIG